MSKRNPDPAQQPGKSDDSNESQTRSATVPKSSERYSDSDPLNSLLSDFVPNLLTNLADQISSGESTSRKIDQPRLADVGNDRQTVYGTEGVSSLEQSRLVDIPATHSFPAKNSTNPAVKVEFKASDISTLSDLLLSDKTEAATNLVKRLHTKNIAAEAIMCDLLGGSARDLGQRWIADQCSFTDVTIATGRLIEIARQFGLRHSADQRQGMQLRNNLSRSGKVLLATAPGEQHVFGLQIINSMLQAKGLRTDLLLGGSYDQLLQAVSSVHYKFIVISIGSERTTHSAQHLIPVLRKNSLQQKCPVYIGGFAVEQYLTSAEICGADGSCTDARELVAIVESHIAGNMVNV